MVIKQRIGLFYQLLVVDLIINDDFTKKFLNSGLSNLINKVGKQNKIRNNSMDHLYLK